MGLSSTELTTLLLLQVEGEGTEQIDALADQVEEFQAQVDAAATSAESLSAGLDAVSAGADEATGSVDAANDVFATWDGILDSTSGALSDLATQTTLVSAAADEALASTDALIASLEAEDAAADGAAGALATTSASADTASVSMEKASGTAKMAALGLLAIGAVSVKMASDFQSSMTHLVTDAGESEKNIGMVTTAILAMAQSVGETPAQLASGMYYIESAGYHGAAGLTVLKAAAEGAAAGNASLQTVADATTTVLKAYGLSASAATGVTSEMIAAVGQGKTTLQDLSGALSSVLPVAAAAHLNFAQVSGAIATMTAQGVSADESTQELANTIRTLSQPNTQAVNEMEQFGISAVNLEKNMGKEGLTGTLDTLVTTIMSHMGPGGLVLQSAFNKSKAAAGDLKTMVADMPAGVRALAEQFESGTLTMSAFRKEIPTSDMGMLSQFEGLYGAVNGFNSQLKAGTPAAATFLGALREITGNATTAQTVLQLTGVHAKVMADNVKTIAGAAKGTGDEVKGFAEITKTADFQFKQAKAGAEAFMISLGSALLPAVLLVLHAVMDILGPLASFAEHNHLIVEIVGTLALALGGIVAAILTFTKVMSLAKLALAAFSEEGELAFVTDPVFLVIAAVVALGVAIYEIVKHWDAVKKAAEEAFGWIEHHLEVLAPLLLTPIGPLLLIAGAIYEIVKHFRDLEHWAGEVVDFIKKHWELLAEILLAPFSPALALILRFHDQIVHFFEDIGAGAVKAADWIVRSFEALPSRLLDVIGTLGQWFMTNVFYPIGQFAEEAVGSIVGFFGGIPGDIENAFTSLATWFDTTVLEPIIGFFTGAGTDISNWAKDGWNAVVGAWNAAAGWFSANVLNPIWGFFIGAGTDIKNWADDGWQAVVTAWNVASSWFNTEVLKPIEGFFTSAGKDIANWAKDGWKAVTTAWNAAGTWFNSTVLKPIEGFFASAGTNISNWAKDGWKAVTSAWDAASAWINTNVISPIEGDFKSLWSGVENAAKTVVSWFETNVWDKLSSDAKSIVSDIVNFFKDIPKDIGNIGKGLLGDVTGGLGKLGSVIGLATGGIVSQPTLAVVGEAGPEMVLPLSGLPGGAGALSGGVSPLPSYAPGSSGGGTTVNVFASAQVSGAMYGNLNQFEQQLGRSIATQLVPASGLRLPTGS